MANKGTFRKGDGRSGRPKGIGNKVTTALKDMILQSLANVGGIQYLEACARDEKLKGAYLTLIGRVLPLQVKDGGADPRVPARVIHEHVTAPDSQK